MQKEKKINLSTDDETSYDFILENIIDSNNNELDDIENDEELTIYLKREKLEEELKKEKIIEKIQNTIEEIIKRSEWKKEEINFVLIVGGTCEIPIIRKTLTDYFGDNVLYDDSRFDRLNSVSKGASIIAKINWWKMKMRLNKILKMKKFKNWFIYKFIGELNEINNLQ